MPNSGPRKNMTIPRFAATAFDAIEKKQGPPDPPAGYKFLERREWDLWKAVTSIRTKDEWRPGDLVLCAMVVQLQTEIQDLDATIKAEGHFISDRFGVPNVHPAVKVRAQLVSQMTMLLGKLSYATGVEMALRERTVDKMRTEETFNSAAECPDGLLAH